MEQKVECFDTRLTAENIDECSARLRAFLNTLKLARRDVSRYVLIVEEILLRNRDELGEQCPVRLRTGTRFFRPVVSLSISSKSEAAVERPDSRSPVRTFWILPSPAAMPRLPEAAKP